MKKGVLLLNGDAPPKDLVKPDVAGAVVFCCDGAASWAKEYGLPVHRLIGDMDSIHPHDLAYFKACADCEIMQLEPEKDQTDAHVAILQAADMGIELLRIFGGRGGRLDHSLTNVLLLLLAKRQGLERTEMVDEYGTAFLAEPVVEIEGRAGQLVSLVSLDDSARVLQTQGLYYPLHNRSLPMGDSLFVSNYMTQERAKIHLTGRVLVILPRKN
ncbi:MAG: thiamine diphosphokinase [Christensenellales bacterium]|jgi:thiamine pyrophosphokinase